ncbi:hypothetical protein KC726_05155 [Candidatus Woesebacteria bacterium]|nr:hypothetical protein [Candidatus Woesebacteria bacterium]
MSNAQEIVVFDPSINLMADPLVTITNSPFPWTDLVGSDVTPQSVFQAGYKAPHKTESVQCIIEIYNQVCIYLMTCQLFLAKQMFNGSFPPELIEMLIELEYIDPRSNLIPILIDCDDNVNIPASIEAYLKILRTYLPSETLKELVFFQTGVLDLCDSFLPGLGVRIICNILDNEPYIFDTDIPPFIYSSLNN